MFDAMHECCQLCRFARTTGLPGEVECHRHPPQARPEEPGEFPPASTFPVIAATEWCGDYAPEPSRYPLTRATPRSLDDDPTQ